ncbi:DUF6458 family protein [Arthrobacter sp. AZCC_0090]|uniref:DUF6458 family protein n=1 Tax=Arthrobacter sp. AZCC_0090 TaxID=2735881 RepID=UPI0016124C4D|nr:DUF6458 family protein [Arthrobacter sp. AZCC_0090]MBB6402858.1 hypothetical protein [Arthrobacter sp. AZCC_0090]
MGIGSSIFLIAIGAILAFAIPGDVVSFIDLHMVGYILMVVGVIGLIVSLFVFGPRRTRRISESRATVDPATGERIVTRDTRDGGL